MASEMMSLEGAVAPPMANGDVIFEQPWQSRVFGMARVLCEQHQFEWNEFRDCLITRISAWEKTPTGDYHYFDHFFSALTDVISQKGLCTTEEINKKSVELNARPHGHDH